jgi:Fe2+ or Zn2+ uptake regulation protein
MKKIFVDGLLAKHGVKPTPQRVVIAEYLANTCNHPTAEEVLEAVQDKLPVALSRATVYNTLNALVEAGVIREVHADPERTRYDANISEHHHFVDVKTGKIYDIPAEDVPQLPQSIKGKFKVKEYQITFFGEACDDRELS